MFTAQGQTLTIQLKDKLGRPIPRCVAVLSGEELPMTNAVVRQQLALYRAVTLPCMWRLLPRKLGCVAAGSCVLRGPRGAGVAVPGCLQPGQRGDMEQERPLCAHLEDAGERRVGAGGQDRGKPNGAPACLQCRPGCWHACLHSPRCSIWRHITALPLPPSSPCRSSPTT